MITEVYDAFKSAGADEEKARRAAEALSNYRDDINEIKSQLRLHHWMLSFNLAFSMMILWKIFSKWKEETVSQKLDVWTLVAVLAALLGWCTYALYATIKYDITE